MNLSPKYSQSIYVQASNGHILYARGIMTRSNALKCITFGQHINHEGIPSQFSISDKNAIPHISFYFHAICTGKE